eukprot:c11260_g1_i1.p1 GENE.c11260_g1_i1~~c11260_g1_i1.p1  ORF type:complete len:175 (-),score=30.77 c11260_g1_i1:172-696(-)
MLGLEVASQETIAKGLGDWEDLPIGLRSTIIHLLNAVEQRAELESPFFELQQLKQRVEALEQLVQGKANAVETQDQIKTVTVKLLRAMQNIAPPADVTPSILQPIQIELLRLSKSQEDLAKMVASQRSSDDWGNSSQSSELRMTMIRNSIRRQETKLGSWSDCSSVSNRISCKR